MAKIVRFTGNLAAFGSGALGTERTIFGAVTQADDLTTNIDADFLRGWGYLGVNENPSKQDFNAVAYVSTLLSAYLHQMGVAEWDVGQEYPADAITNRNGIIYQSQVDNTGNDPASDTGANWLPAGQQGSTAISGLTNANVVLTMEQQSAGVIFIDGVLTANIEIDFLATLKGKWLVVNNTTGGFTVTAKTAAGTGVVLSSGENNIYCDGTDIITNAVAPGGACLAYRSTALSITNSADTKIPFDATEYNVDSIYDTVNGWIKPAKAGYYQIEATVNINSSVPNNFYVSLYKNGAVYLRGTQISSGQAASVSALVYFDGISDYLEIYAYQASGGTVGVNVGSGPYLTHLNAHFVRGA